MTIFPDFKALVPLAEIIGATYPKQSDVNHLQGCIIEKKGHAAALEERRQNESAAPGRGV